MKKAMLLMITLATMLVASSAFAGNKAEQKTGYVPYNGITVFDVGTVSTMPETTVAWEQAEMPYNGVTVFELGQSGTSANNYAVSGVAAGGQRPEEKPYNGITVF